MLALAIRAYQHNRLVRRLVRLAVFIHHLATPRAARVPCPYAGRCAAAGLAEARAGGWAAARPILARMARCDTRGGGEHGR